MELDTEDTQKNRGTLVSIDGKVVSHLEHGGEVTDVAFSSDSSLVATSGTDGKIVFWSIPVGERQFELNNSEPVISMAVNPGGTLVAAGLNDKIKIWDLVTKKEVAPDLLQQGNIATVAFSPDGKMVASGG